MGDLSYSASMFLMHFWKAVSRQLDNKPNTPTKKY